MRRHFYMRGQRVDVEELDDVLAVQIDVDESGNAVARRRAFGDRADEAMREADFDLPDEAAEAFDKANWVFVKPRRRLRSAIDDREQVPGAAAIGKVLRRGDGSIVIATDLLNVQVSPGLSPSEAEAVLQDASLSIVTRLRFAPNLYEVRAESRSDSLEASVELHDDPRFVFAEPSFTEHIPQRFTPTDPDFNEQWQWSNDGSNGGTAGADVSAEEAWDHTLGAGMRVAVIDNGFDADHEDLAAGVLAESGFFTTGAGGVAGFTQGTAGIPGSNHGTFCAGLVGARHNNGTGVSGGAPECGLLLVACLGDQVGTQTTLARAVGYAADPSNEVAGADPADGADVLVCSLGPNGADWALTQTLELAIEAAAANGRQGRGLAIFWAASNGNNVDVGQDEVVSHDDVVAVVRSDRNDLEDNAARGDEVELIAPGVDVYSTRAGDAYGTGTGTSYAAPIAASCAALALSTNPELTRDELRAIMRNTADQVGGVVYDATGHDDDYGFGRVNAFAAVVTAAREVELLSSSVVFSDVPEGETTARAVVWRCSGLEGLTFEVVSGPVTTVGSAGAFSLLLGASVVVPAPGVGAGVLVRLWLTYTGSSAGDAAVGEVRVRCVETGEEWLVPLSANTIARPTAAVVLVLDQSGSMDWDAGDGRTRVAVLRESAQALVDVLKSDTGVGVVRFDHDAYLGMAVVDAGPEVFGSGRAHATAAVASHVANPAGATSIGDGVELAAVQLDAVTGAYDETAMIVLTDGQENAPKLIADVAGSIDDQVFAIGLGESSAINPVKLSALTNGSGGYVVMTGVLSQDEYFVLSKYYLQILAGVTNEEIVVDPSGYLRPGIHATVPFILNRSDASADVILLCPAPGAMRFVLESPSGETFAASATPVGMSYVAGQGVAYYRFNLPVVDGAGKQHWSGRWQVHLECERGAFSEYLQKLEENDPKAYAYAATHGLRWAVEVHTRSSLRMAAHLDQESIEPGAVMRLGARLTEFGLPLEDQAEIMVLVDGPTGPDRLVMAPVGSGVFGVEYAARAYGLYRFRVMAAGRTIRGERFTREQTLTGSVYMERPPEEDPRPPQDEEPDLTCDTVAEAFSAVLAADRRLAKALDAALRRRRTSLKELLACLGITQPTSLQPTVVRPNWPTINAPIVWPGVPTPTRTELPEPETLADMLDTIADIIRHTGG